MSQIVKPVWFRTDYNNPVQEIKTPGSILNPQDNNMFHNSKNFLWDTGASMSGISKSIVDRLKLPKIGRTKIFTVSKEEEHPVYVAKITLPNPVIQIIVHVVGLELPNTDFLIGMNIIKLGSFLISTDSRTGKQYVEFIIPPLNGSFMKKFNENLHF